VTEKLDGTLSQFLSQLKEDHNIYPQKFTTGVKCSVTKTFGNKSHRMFKGSEKNYSCHFQGNSLNMPNKWKLCLPKSWKTSASKLLSLKSWSLCRSVHKSSVQFVRDVFNLPWPWSDGLPPLGTKFFILSLGRAYSFTVWATQNRYP
jgi:hypothetical protein